MTAALSIVLAVALGAPGRAPAPQTPEAAVRPPTAAELQTAIGQLGAFDDNVRQAASQTVRRADAAMATAALAAAVHAQSDSYVQYRALVLLSGFGGPTVPETMTSVLDDRNDRLRAVAYEWFEHHLDPSVLPRLLAALPREDSEFVRPALTRAVAAYGTDPRAQAALLPLVDKGVDEFRGEVIQALGDYRAAYARDAILRVAKLDGPLQEDAILALGKIGDRSVLPDLTALQRSASRERQPAIAAAICLLGTNCPVLMKYLVDTIHFGESTATYQPLLRGAAHALAELALATGDTKAVGELFDAGVSAKDPSRAPLALGVGLVALRDPALMQKTLEGRSDLDAAALLLQDAFDMLEEDFEEEQFYAAVRHAYWAAPEGSVARTVAERLIRVLGF